MKLLIKIGFLFFCSLNLVAQEITIYGQQSLWHADNLCDIQFTGCNYTQLNQGGLLGYAHHPSGQLWLVLADYSGDHYIINLFDVLLESCNYSLLYSIELPKNWSVGNAVNIDHLGRIYLRINEFDSTTNISTRTFSRISNPGNPIIERLFVIFPQQQIFEAHFSNSRVYIPEIRKPLIYVFDTNFILLDTIIMQKHIWGLTSISYGCDSIITYAAHLNITTQDYANNVKDTTMYISRFDLETGNLTPVCNYWMGENRANTQLTSPLEFLSSDPECDLLIDLDRDNSTGVYPYDYLDSTDYCTMVEAPICDGDIYIHTSSPLDSIVLIVSGIAEDGDEYLISSVLPAGFTMTQRNDSTYVLTSSNPTDSIYQEALRSIRYQHAGLQRTAGERRIVIQGFNAIKDGVKVMGRIHISGLVFAGEDVTLLICTDTLIQDMSAMTGGQPGGYWTPSLMLGGHVFNSSLDMASSYRYIILDPICGNDTAVVTVHRDASAPVDLLGADQVLCIGDTIEIAVTQPAQSILWDDGSGDAERDLTMAGSYWVVLETSGGCTYADSLIIKEGQQWMPTIETLNPVCDLPNGEISIDPIEFDQNQSIHINGTTLTAPWIGSLAAGVYEITTVSDDGCPSITEIILAAQPILDIALDTQAVVIQGVWEEVKYIEQNNVTVTDIHFDPATSIRWTGSTIEVYGDKDQPYEITFIDENGCTDIHLLNVLVEKAQGIYLPNIFRPGSTTGNAVWQPSISETYTLEVLRIYDRWGSMMYQSTTDPSWDGTSDGQDCPSGVFVYQLILNHVSSGDRKVMIGNITLLR